MKVEGKMSSPAALPSIRPESIVAPLSVTVETVKSFVIGRVDRGLRALETVTETNSPGGHAYSPQGPATVISAMFPDS